MDMYLALQGAKVENVKYQPNGTMMIVLVGPQGKHEIYVASDHILDKAGNVAWSNR